MVTIYTWTASCNLAAPSGNFLCSRSGFAAACDGAAGACGCFAKLAATAAGWMCGERVIDFAARCGAQAKKMWNIRILFAAACIHCKKVMGELERGIRQGLGLGSVR